MVFDIIYTFSHTYYKRSYNVRNMYAFWFKHQIASYLVGLLSLVAGFVEDVGGFGNAFELRLALEVEQNGGFFDVARF